jgi:hypothetical protein
MLHLFLLQKAMQFIYIKLKYKNIDKVFQFIDFDKSIRATHEIALT